MGVVFLGGLGPLTPKNNWWCCDRDEGGVNRVRGSVYRWLGVPYISHTHYDKVGYIIIKTMLKGSSEISRCRATQCRVAYNLYKLLPSKTPFERLVILLPLLSSVVIIIPSKTPFARSSIWLLQRLSVKTPLHLCYQNSIRKVVYFVTTEVKYINLACTTKNSIPEVIYLVIAKFKIEKFAYVIKTSIR